MPSGLPRRVTIRAAHLARSAALGLALYAMSGGLEIPTARAAGGPIFSQVEIHELTAGNIPYGWAAAGPIDIRISATSQNRDTLDANVLVDGVSIGTYEQAAYIGTQTPTDGLVPRVIATYDPGSTPDGSDHTLQIVVKAKHSTAQDSRSFTFRLDKVAPTLDPPGGPFAVDGSYINATQAYPLTIDAYDETSGVSGAQVAIDDTAGIPDAFLNECPSDASTPSVPCDQDLSLDHDESVTGWYGWHWSEGANHFVATAYDRAGNTTSSAPWTVYLDETAPAAPLNLRALRDPDSGETYIEWDDGGDPALADGSPGSGTDHYSYRYSIGGGAWTESTTTDQEYADVGQLAVGTSIAIEVDATDAVGNTGTTATATAVTQDETTSGVWDPGDDDFQPETPAAPQARAQAGPRPRITVHCTFAKDRPAPPTLVDLGNPPEDGIGIQGGVNVTCRPTDPENPEDVANWVDSKASVLVCVQLADSSSHSGWRDLKCKPGAKSFVTAGDPLKASVTAVCRPGTRNYRLWVSLTTSGPFIPDTFTGFYPYQPRDCNEAGAWRYTAKQDGGTPRHALSRTMLLDTSFDQLPPGDASLGGQGGWEAHHIVPAGEGRFEDPKGVEASRAERYAYDCGIEPNGAENGVWLRGPDLVSSNSSSWNKLDADGKKRANHRSKGVGLHSESADYYRYVANQLEKWVNTSSDACTSPSDAVHTALGGVRSDLINGKIPTAP